MSGTGFLVGPPSESGPALLVLGSWRGLDEPLESICRDFADQGYVTLAPDLVGDARSTTDDDEARLWLAERDMNVVADLVLSSAQLLRTTSITPDAPIGVIGFQMGASWALWLASRAPELVDAVCFFYGAQDVDRLDLDCAVQGHFAEVDALVDDDTKALLSASLHLSCEQVECFDYPGTSSGFYEPGPTFDSEAAALARERMLAWLERSLTR